MADDDNELSELVVGKWTEVMKSPGMVLTTTYTHNKDRSWKLEASANYDDGAAIRRDSATGTWTVEDGRLIATVETSDIQVLEKGDTFNWDIIVATEYELHLMGSAPGETTVWTNSAD